KVSATLVAKMTAEKVLTEDRLRLLDQVRGDPNENNPAGCAPRPIVLAGCEKSDPEQVEFDKPAPTAAVRMMPSDERTMIVIVQRAHRARLTRPARALELCEFFKSTSVRNWTGVISHLSTNNDDRGILTIKIADD